LFFLDQDLRTVFVNPEILAGLTLAGPTAARPMDAGVTATYGAKLSDSLKVL
jgi:hypothetical protein